MSQNTGKSVFSNLWERRLPQFFATYIGICWGILQFLTFASTRYGLNDSLIDKFLLFAAILIPAVLLFIYNHGKPGKDSWTKLEKAFIPSNFILAGAVAMFMGGSSGVSAAPTAVEITTEEGEQITRYVPSAVQTRSLALFPLDMIDGENDWARLGFPLLLAKDLEQDMRIFARNPGSLEYHLNSYDYEINDKIPFSTKLQIANKTKVDYFVTGELNKEGDNWNLELKIFETGTGELFQEYTYSSADFYNLVDECAVNISSGLFLEENNSSLGEVVDLPASDLISPNLAALSLFVKGRNAEYFEEE